MAKLEFDDEGSRLVEEFMELDVLGERWRRNPCDQHRSETENEAVAHIGHNSTPSRDISQLGGLK